MARTDVILTPDQRVRAFISSTPEELPAERAAAWRAIRRMHLVPVWYERGVWPYPDQEPRLAALIDGIRAAGTVCHRAFNTPSHTPRDPERLLVDDLVVLLARASRAQR